MAKSSVPNVAIFYLFLALCMSLRLPISEAKVTNLTLYMHDYANPPNNTFASITGIAGKLWGSDQFGTVFATDNPLTEGPDVNSPSVGQAQGIYVVTSAVGDNLLVLLSIVFTNDAYDGSTIELQGTSKQYNEIRELAVVSGTGKFRLGRGYAVSEYYHADAETGYTIMKFNVTVQQSPSRYDEM